MTPPTVLSARQSRRGLLGVVSALAVSPAAPALALSAAVPDADLLDACARHAAAVAATDRRAALVGAEPDASPKAVHDALWKAMDAAQDVEAAALLTVLVLPRATTLPGLIARARVARRAAGDLFSPDAECPSEQAVVGLVDDLLAYGGAA